MENNLHSGSSFNIPSSDHRSRPESNHKVESMNESEDKVVDFTELNFDDIVL